MNKLHEIASEWLTSQRVNVVIGYINGSQGKTRAGFITKANDVAQLINDERCTQNLAHYLTKHHVKTMGHIGLVATVPVLRSVVQLVSECQINPDTISIIAIDGKGGAEAYTDINQVEVFLNSTELPRATDEAELIAKLQAMTVEQRFAYWEEQLSHCVKCYACRSNCPMCYCTRCSVECNQPQWVSVPSHVKGNFEWHVLRAMHLGGRCVGCGECSRACPMDIHIAVLPMYLSDVLGDAFGSKAGTSLKQVATMSSYCLGDKDHFIQ